MEKKVMSVKFKKLKMVVCSMVLWSDVYGRLLTVS